MSPTDRRRQILEAAEKLFRHYGPAKTTVGDIAREVGIAVGSVYLEFCSKNDIVQELSQKRHYFVVQAMRAASRRGDATAKLTAALEARVDALFQLASEGTHSCDLVLCGPRARPSPFHSAELGVVAELLDAGMRSGELTSGDPSALAELIQRAYVTLSPPALFELSPAEARRTARALNRILVEGLRSRVTRRRAGRRRQDA